MTAETTRAAAGASLHRRIVLRSLGLLVTAVSLYLLAPSLLSVFSSWRQLNRLNWWWMIPALVFEAASYVSLWMLQRIALRTKSWFAVGTSQLTATAAGSVIPGGGATATAVQYGILVRSGVPAPRVASGLAAAWAATTASAFALPAVGAVAAIGGTAAPKGLREVAYLGGGGFILMAVAAVIGFTWDRPVLFVGRTIRTVAGWLRRGGRFAELPEHLLEHRNQLRVAFTDHPITAFLATIGKWAFDYLALVCILAALGVRPEPALVLLSYGAAQILSMIPATPGGLGFVEAGLVGLLTLAGVSAGTATVATFTYRLIGFWLPLPAGLVAYLLARRRYGAVPEPEPAP